MPRLLDRLAIRAIPKAGLGMAIATPTGSGKVKAATVSTTYSSPGQPLNLDWDAQLATNDYLGHTYVMRCVRLRADTVAGLPFVAGPDPENPSVTTDSAALADMLGPASPQHPGGPNPSTTARALWAWSIVQYIVTGRMAWELQLDPGDKSKTPRALWPLVAAALQPVPSPAGEQRWFDSFQYQTPVGVIPLPRDRVFYGWKPSIEDWRQAESPLRAARLPIQTAIACDRYMWSLLSNGMAPASMVVSNAFEEAGDRRAWEDQFFAEFSGFDNAGKTIFAYTEDGETVDGKPERANVQVIPLAMKSVDAQLFEMIQEAKSDINIGLGVAKSLLGDASQRIYANADSEYRNFWTITAVNDITELQDMVNVGLAPRVGPDVGWFDLSNVTALQPESVFMPPALKDAIDEGVVTAAQAADLLHIPSVVAKGEDTATAPIGEESDAGSSAMMRSLRLHGQGSPKVDAPEGWRWLHQPTTTFTLRSGKAGWGLVKAPRQRFRLHTGIRSMAVESPGLGGDVTDLVARIQQRRELGIRSASKLAVSGIVVKGADTGRVLLLQRCLDDKDPASGRWEFPGGHIEPGEDSFDAARREWQEEVGVPLPDGNVAGSWTSPNGIYRGHVLVVPAEAKVRINPERGAIRNPDNPRRKYREVAAWHDPAHVAGNPSVRDEVSDSASTWLPVVKAAQTVDTGKRSLGEPDLDRMDRLGDALALSVGV